MTKKMSTPANPPVRPPRPAGNHMTERTATARRPLDVGPEAGGEALPGRVRARPGWAVLVEGGVALARSRRLPARVVGLTRLAIRSAEDDRPVPGEEDARVAVPAQCAGEDLRLDLLAGTDDLSATIR